MISELQLMNAVMRQATLKLVAIAIAIFLAATVASRANAEAALSLDTPVLDWNSLRRLGVDPSQVSSDREYLVTHKLNGKITNGVIFDAKRLVESDEFSTNFSASPDSRNLTRLESSWTRFVDDGNRQLKLGDAISNSGGWGDSVRFGGVRFGSSEAVRADLVTAPNLRTYGVAVVPSVADLLFENNQNTPNQSSANSRSQLTTTGMPHVSAPNQLSLLVNDALGRPQLINQPLTTSAQLIAKGRSDYSIDIGRVREDFGIDSLQYGRWFASSMLRYGLSKDVTLNWRAAQLKGDTGVIGLGVNSKLGSAGVVSATVASSNRIEEDGWLARLGYEYSDDSLKFTIRHRVQSAGYRDIGSAAQSIPVKRRTLASVGLNMGQLGNLAVTGAAQTYGDQAHGDIVALSHQLPVKSLGVISTAAGYSANVVKESTFLVSFTHRFIAKNSRKLLDLKQMANIFETEGFIDALGKPAMHPNAFRNFGIF